MAKSITDPSVSVIIPVYNAEKYIRATIESVLAQTYPNLEIIVVDDASTDGTFEAASAILTERPLQIIRKTINSGAAASRNQGYGLAKGDLIKFLDGDDLINPEMIARQVELLDNDDCIVSAKWGRFINDDITTFRLSPEECWQSMPAVDWICSSWAKTNAMTNPGIFLIPRKIIEKAGLWDESLSLLDDTEYFAKTMLTANKIVFSPGSVLYYRSGVSGSLSRTTSRKGFQSAFSAIAKATSALLAYRSDHTAKLACANFWQNFIYDAYPAYPDLVKKAEEQLRTLPKPSLPFPSGGYTKMLLKVLDWKTVKTLKQKLRINN